MTRQRLGSSKCGPVRSIVRIERDLHPIVNGPPMDALTLDCGHRSFVMRRAEHTKRLLCSECRAPQWAALYRVDHKDTNALRGFAKANNIPVSPNPKTIAESLLGQIKAALHAEAAAPVSPGNFDLKLQNWAAGILENASDDPDFSEVEPAFHVDPPTLEPIEVLEIALEQIVDSSTPLAPPPSVLDLFLASGALESVHVVDGKRVRFVLES